MIRKYALAALCWLTLALPASGADKALSPGEYLFRAAGCAGCHTDEENKGAPLAGGRALRTPFGVFYAPNITPDPETGIGRWSAADFTRALRDGLSPRGRHYYPAFPYTSYTRMTDADINAIRTYLFSQKPVRQENKPHELPWYLRSRASLWPWKLFFFRAGAFEPQLDRPEEWNRGAYLVKAVGHCGECHTPRNFLGGFKDSHKMAGNPDGADGAEIPNITPDRKTGIGSWTVNDIASYLKSGATPDGDYAGDVMADVIDHSTSYLTDQDRRAIAMYIVSLPAIETQKHEHNHSPDDKKPSAKEKSKAPARDHDHDSQHAQDRGAQKKKPSPAKDPWE